MYQYRDCKKCSKNVENWKCPMMAMMEEDDDRDLEALFPKVYFGILPIVQKHIDKMEEMHGEMHMPEKEEMEEMLDNILNEVEPDVENMMRDDIDNSLTRQFPERAILRDLIGIVGVGEMMGRRRRRRRPYPFPPYGRPGGYYGGYPPYPGRPPYPQYPQYPGRPPYPQYPQYPGRPPYSGY